MTKYFLPIIVSLLGLPIIASAAFNDVQFPQDTTIRLTASNLNFTITAGSRIASLNVDTGSFQIGLENGSFVIITSADKVLMPNSANYPTDCGQANSSLNINYVGAPLLVTVTPGGTCSQNQNIPVGGGGGGGVSAPTTTVGAVTVSAATGGTATATTAENTKAIVEVPAGAVTANTTINVTPTAKADVSATASVLSGLSVVGGFVYNLTAISAGTAVTSFNKPLTLTFTYTNAQVAGLSEAALQVYRWTGTQWTALPSTINAAANTITTTTTQFSYFAILGGAAAVDKTALIAQTKAQMIEIIKQMINLITQLIQIYQAQLAGMQT